MDLYTRCSSCDTVFRVTTRHLQASGGQVRCGRCEAVFDAFASLTAMPPGESKMEQDTDEVHASPPAATSVAAEATEAAPGAATSAAAQTGSVLPDRTRAESAKTAATGIAATNSPATESAFNGSRKKASESSPESAEAGEREESAVGDVSTNLYEWEFKPTPKTRNRLWLSLSLLMLAGAVVQAGYVFRTGVLVNVPQAKPLYQQVCRWLSCEIGLPRLTDQLNIDASDLQLIDPGKPNLVRLTALVRNRARVPVEYPAFELTLTNAREQVVARRVFMPAEYLAEGVRQETGLPGHQELSVSLYLDTGPLRAAGYRIYLFYPS